MSRHLLTLDSLGRDGIRHTLDLAVRIKARGGDTRDALAGGRVGLLFDKPSTRTRVSFEAASFVEALHKRQGLMVCCPEEIAFRKGWISAAQVLSLGAAFKNNAYGQYLVDLANGRLDR